MRNLAFIFVTFLFAAFSISAQSSCPAVSVTGPSGPTPIDSSMTFAINPIDSGFGKLTYNWSVNKGIIVSGQGTFFITVGLNADLRGEKIIATVEIGGLPSGCPNTALAFGEVKPICGHPPKLDEYGKISWRAEKKRLDPIAAELKNDDNIKVYIVINGEYLISKTHSEKIEKYLTRTHKIAKDRILIVSRWNIGIFQISIWKMPIDERKLCR